MDKLRVAIIGTGKIGCDLLMKVINSNFLECTSFIGRNKDSLGISFSKSLGIPTFTDGADSLVRNNDSYDIVIDATSAFSHIEHSNILKKLKKKIIDLTPAKLGGMCIPGINAEETLAQQNISMVTCGGQASSPIVYGLGKVHSNIEYIEVISSISSASAGHATRLNIDEYINTTEEAIKIFSGCLSAKAILNINPAVPSVSMKTTVFAKIKNPNLKRIQLNIEKMVEVVQQYAPGYKLLVPPYYDGEKVAIIIEVVGKGDYLPKFAGNLDIITCAAIYIAEKIANDRLANTYKSVI